MRSCTVLSASVALAIMGCGSEPDPSAPSTTSPSTSADQPALGVRRFRRDFVRGTAEHQGADPPYPVIRVRIEARNNAKGTGATGFLIVRGDPPIVPYRGRVTCLNVNGNDATIGIEIVRSGDPSLVGKGQLWHLVDGSPDQIAGYPTTPTAPTECPALDFSVPVVSGNYQFNDATP